MFCVLIIVFSLLLAVGFDAERRLIALPFVKEVEPLRPLRTVRAVELVLADVFLDDGREEAPRAFEAAERDVAFRDETDFRAGVAIQKFY